MSWQQQSRGNRIRLRSTQRKKNSVNVLYFFKTPKTLLHYTVTKHNYFEGCYIICLLTVAIRQDSETERGALFFYPGGKGTLFIGVILGFVVARAAEAKVPGFGPLAVCEGPPVAAPVPESSCWFEHPLAEAWDEPSEAGPSLSSLGEELLEDAG